MYQHSAVIDYRRYLAETQMSSHSQRAYASRVGGFLKYVEERQHSSGSCLVDPTSYREAADRYVCFLRDELGNKAASVNSTITAMRHFAVFLRLNAELPDFHRPAQEELPRTRRLKDDEIRRLLQSASSFSFKDFALVQVLLTTGLRIGECRDLNFGDLIIAFDRAEIIVRKLNGERDRRIDLPPATAEALTRWLQEREGIEHRSPALFVNRYGDRFTTTGLDAIVRKVGHRAGLDICSFVLRTTFIARLAETISDTSRVAEIGGVKRLSNRVFSPTAKV